MKGKVHRVGSDPHISLADLQLQISEWIATFGEDSILAAYAGYKNVDLCIDTRKTRIKKYKKEI